jgi:tRNA(Ile)-lysidine synthase
LRLLSELVDVLRYSPSPIHSPGQPIDAAEFAAALDSLARFETRPFVAVATSGGPDSLALTILADRWARARGGEIRAVSVDHRLRPESGAELRLLGAWLRQRGIRHEILVWTGVKPTTGIEEAARTARYALLAAWCRAQGCLHLLLAHHREDQIETYLMRRRADSGPLGLAGMSAIRELAPCRLLRPLLGFPKARLAALLEAERQPWVADPSNRNPAFERARLRAQSRSAAEEERLSAEIRAHGRARRVRENERDRLLAGAVALHPAGFAVLDPALLMAVPEAAEGALAALVMTIGGGYYPPRRARLAHLREVLAAGGARGHTLGGCRFVRRRGHILVLRELARAAEPVRLVPGASLLWDRRFLVGLPETAAGPVVISYLGAAGVVELGRRSGRPRPPLPRLVLPVLPAARDEGGLACVPDLGYRRAEAAKPMFLFRPANPLSTAGFTVV